MTTTGEHRPIGVRAVTGALAGRLTWVSGETLATADLERGARVLVRDGDHQWLGEVIVPAGRLLEAPPLPGLPVIVRLAMDADGWPASPVRAGQALHDALALPPA